MPIFSLTIPLFPGPISLGFDFARARYSNSISSTRGINFTDGVNNVWRMSSGIVTHPNGAASSFEMATVDSGSALTLVNSAATALLHSVGWCNSDGSLCIVDAGGLSVGLPELDTCSSELSSGEMILAWKLSSTPSATERTLPALLMQWKPIGHGLTTEPALAFWLEASVRLLVPNNGWMPNQAAIGAKLGVAAGEGNTTVPASTIVRSHLSHTDSSQTVRVSGSVVLQPGDPSAVIDIKLQPTLPSLTAGETNSIWRAAISITLKPNGCVRTVSSDPHLYTSILPSAAAPILPFDSVMTWSCAPGYTLYGASNATCMSSGYWSAPLPVCNEVLCSFPQAIRGGTYSQPANNSLYAFVGNETQVQCEPFHMLTMDVKLVCDQDGEWTPKDDEHSIFYVRETRSLRVSCLPDYANGACTEAAEGCTQHVLPSSCVSHGGGGICFYCGDVFAKAAGEAAAAGKPLTANLTAAPCQPAQSCYSTDTSVQTPFCNNTYTPPVDTSVKINTTELETFPDCTLTQRTSIARCSSLSAYKCLSDVTCQLCAAPLSSALRVNDSADSEDLDGPSLPPVCQFKASRAEACKIATKYDNFTLWQPNNATLITVYGFIETTQCPDYVLYGDLPSLQPNVTADSSPVNYTIPVLSEAEQLVIELGLKRSNTTCDYQCASYGDIESCMTMSDNACAWCSVSQSCTPLHDCFNLNGLANNGTWVYSCDGRTQPVTDLDALIQQRPSVCQPSAARSECELASIRFCSLYPNCIRCDSGCIYSSARDTCILEQTNTTFTLVGHSRCPYAVLNYSAIDEAAKPPSVQLTFEDNIPNFKGGQKVPKYPTAPSLGLVDGEIQSTPEVPGTCSNFALSHCVNATSSADCSRARAAGFPCTWCGQNVFAIDQSPLGPGECRFTPEASCTLNGQSFGSGCYLRCSLQESTCQFNLNPANCSSSAAAAVLGVRNAAQSNVCSWCPTAGVCYASQRCFFGSSWSYKCDDIDVGALALPVSLNISVQPRCDALAIDRITYCANLPADRFCNAEANCHLCSMPDPFNSESKSVQCTYRPPTGKCAAQGYYYEAGQCPIYTGQLSDCTTDETIESIPWCPLPSRRACEALNATSCNTADGCQWCSDWETPNGHQACAYSPFVESLTSSSEASQLCQFNFTGTDRLYYTGFGQGSCPIPADAIALAELVSESAGAFPCNFAQQQCLAVTSPLNCSSNPACQWCAMDGVCIPGMSCYSGQLNSVTPFYCPTASCSADHDSCTLHTSQQECATSPNCNWCFGAQCVSNPSSICSTASGATVTIQGDSQCPVHLRRQVTLEVASGLECTPSQTMCLITLDRDECRSNSDCDWCGDGVCQPVLPCNSTLANVVFGGGCRASACPFLAPAHCLQLKDAASCAASATESGVPCIFCPSEIPNEGSCYFSPRTTCVQTLYNSVGETVEVAWTANPQCQLFSSVISTSTSQLVVNLTVSVRAHDNITLTYSTALKTPLLNISTSFPELPTSAGYFESSASLTVARPTLPSSTPIRGEVVRASLSYTRGLPTPAFKSSIEIGRRRLVSTPDGWSCHLNVTRRHTIVTLPLYAPTPNITHSVGLTYPPSCCAYCFASPALPSVIIPPAQPSSPGDRMMASPIVMANGSPLQQGCNGDVFEYWNSETSSWIGTYTGLDGQSRTFSHVFYVTNGNQLWISTLQSWQSNLAQLLEGRLGRLQITCNNGQQSCMQFTIGSTQDPDLLLRPSTPNDCSVLPRSYGQQPAAPVRNTSTESVRESIQSIWTRLASLTNISLSMEGTVPAHRTQLVTPSEAVNMTTLTNGSIGSVSGCCSYRFANGLPTVSLPPAQPYSPGDILLTNSNRIVMSDGSPLAQGCNGDEFEYWDTATSTWVGHYTGLDGQLRAFTHVFYATNSDQLWISTLQTWQANLHFLLNGRLGRLKVICNNGQRSCLQFIIGSMSSNSCWMVNGLSTAQLLSPPMPPRWTDFAMQLKPKCTQVLCPLTQASSVRNTSAFELVYLTADTNPVTLLPSDSTVLPLGPTVEDDSCCRYSFTDLGLATLSWSNHRAGAHSSVVFARHTVSLRGTTLNPTWFPLPRTRSTNGEAIGACTATNFEFWDTASHSWMHAIAGVDVTRLFFMSAYSPYLHLNLTLLERIPGNTPGAALSSSSPLFGLLGRVAVRCANGTKPALSAAVDLEDWTNQLLSDVTRFEPSCLQFNLGRPYWPGPSTNQSVEESWITSPGFCHAAVVAIDVAPVNTTSTIDGEQPQVTVNVSTVSVDSAVCQFVLPGSLRVQAVTIGGATGPTSSSVFVNGEFATLLPSAGTNRSNKVTADLHLRFTDSAPMPMVAGAYQVHLATSFNTLEEAKSIAFLATLGVESSNFLTGEAWECTMADSNRSFEPYLLSAGSDVNVTWYPAQILSSNNVTNGSLPVVPNIDSSANWISLPSSAVTDVTDFNTILCRFTITFEAAELAHMLESIMAKTPSHTFHPQSFKMQVNPQPDSIVTDPIINPDTLHHRLAQVQAQYATEHIDTISSVDDDRVLPPRHSMHIWSNQDSAEPSLTLVLAEVAFNETADSTEAVSLIPPPQQPVNSALTIAWFDETGKRHVATNMPLHPTSSGTGHSFHPMWTCADTNTLDRFSTCRPCPDPSQFFSCSNLVSQIDSIWNLDNYVTTLDYNSQPDLDSALSWIGRSLYIPTNVKGFQLELIWHKCLGGSTAATGSELQQSTGGKVTARWAGPITQPNGNCYKTSCCGFSSGDSNRPYRYGDDQFLVTVVDTSQTGNIGSFTFLTAYVVPIYIANHAFKATFGQMIWCPVDVTGKYCTDSARTLFTPNRNWYGDDCSGCETTRRASISLTHSQLQTTHRSLLLQVRGISANSEVTPSVASATQMAFETFDCDPSFLCARIALDDSQDLPWDTPIEIKFVADFNGFARLSYFQPGTTADNWTVEIIRKRNVDHSMRALNLAPDDLTTFSPSIKQYELVIPRRPFDPPFNLVMRTNDPWVSKVTAIYRPPQSDNGPMSTVRQLTLQVDQVNPNSALPDGLFTIAQLSKSNEYTAIPYGVSQIEITITNDARTASSVYTIKLVKMRHTDRTIKALLPSIGLMESKFSRTITDYQLLIHTNDPTQRLRIMYTLNDVYANSTASLFSPNPKGANNPLDLMGEDVPVLKSFMCGYQFMLLSLLPYGPSTLSISSMADDGGVQRTTIAINKVSFRLLNWTSSIATLEPTFAPTHSAYQINLANAQNSLTLTATYADPTAVLSWRFQAAGSRRGSQRLTNAINGSDVATGFIRQQVTLTDMPMGVASVQVKVKATDGSNSIYILRIERAVDNSLALQEFGLSTSDQSAPGQSDSTPPNDSTSNTILVPNFSILHSNYTLHVPANQQSVTLSFVITAIDVDVIATWVPNPNPTGTPQYIVPLVYNEISYRFAVVGVSGYPGLLHIVIMRGDVPMQEYFITILQRISTNAFLKSAWVNKGAFTPAFAFNTFTYNLSLALSAPSQPAGYDLQLIMMKQDEAARMTITYVCPAFTDSVTGKLVPATSVPLNQSDMLVTTDSRIGTVANIGYRVSLKEAAIPPRHQVQGSALPIIRITLTAVDGTLQSYYIHIIRTLAPQPTLQQLSYAAAVQLTIGLRMNLAAIDIATVRELLVLDLSLALDVSVVRFVVGSIREGSIMVDLVITPPPTNSSHPSAIQLSEALLYQMCNYRSSPINFGAIMQYLDLSRVQPGIVGCMNPETLTFLPACTDETRVPPSDDQFSNSKLPDYAIGLIAIGCMLAVTALGSVVVRYRRVAMTQSEVKSVSLTLSIDSLPVSSPPPATSAVLPSQPPESVALPNSVHVVIDSPDEQPAKIDTCQDADFARSSRRSGPKHAVGNAPRTQTVTTPLVLVCLTFLIVALLPCPTPALHTPYLDFRWQQHVHRSICIIPSTREASTVLNDWRDTWYFNNPIDPLSAAETRAMYPDVHVLGFSDRWALRLSKLKNGASCGGFSGLTGLIFDGKHPALVGGVVGQESDSICNNFILVGGSPTGQYFMCVHPDVVDSMKRPLPKIGGVASPPVPSDAFFGSMAGDGQRCEGAFATPNLVGGLNEGLPFHASIHSPDGCRQTETGLPLAALSAQFCYGLIQDNLVPPAWVPPHLRNSFMYPDDPNGIHGGRNRVVSIDITVANQGPISQFKRPPNGPIDQQDAVMMSATNKHGQAVIRKWAQCTPNGAGQMPPTCPWPNTGSLFEYLHIIGRALGGKSQFLRIVELEERGMFSFLC